MAKEQRQEDPQAGEIRGGVIYGENPNKQIANNSVPVNHGYLSNKYLIMGCLAFGFPPLLLIPITIGQYRLAKSKLGEGSERLGKTGTAKKFGAAVNKAGNGYRSFYSAATTIGQGQSKPPRSKP